VAVVQVVLFGRKHGDRCPRLLAWIRRLLRRGNRSDHQTENHEPIPHVSLRAIQNIDYCNTDNIL
jgi:hypothetical protein